MSCNEDKELKTIVLGALLHDIGKIIFLTLTLNKEEKKDEKNRHENLSAFFIQEEEKKFTNPEEIIDIVAHHSKPEAPNAPECLNIANRTPKQQDNARIVSIADKLSAKERKGKDINKSLDGTKQKIKDRVEVPFQSVFDEVNLGSHILKSESINYLPQALTAIDKEILFPKSEFPNIQNYIDLYNSFKREFEKIQQDNIISIYFILYKYIWGATSTGGKEDMPDISLFDHTKVVAAIASCIFKVKDRLLDNLKVNLAQLYQAITAKNATGKFKELQKIPLVLLLSADMFGIQDFVYTPSNEPGTSKRLRGRSCCVSLLTDIIARYIVYELELSFVNILYCSSGEFQILLPNTKECKDKLNVILDEINELMFIWTNGKLGFIFADTEVSPLDFTNWDDVLKRVDNKMNALKKQKLKNLLQQEEKRKRILSPQEKIKGKKDICQSCGNTIPYDKEDKICDLCEIFEQIGKKLPYTKAIILHQGNGEISKNNEGIEVYKINFGKFGKAYLVIDNRKDQTPPSFKTSGEIKHLEYYTLNITDNFINAATFENASASYGFKFIGNAVARDKENGQVLEFEKIASLSEGAKKLGILKLDVDLTKLIFQIGLSAKEDSDRTISRIATLSRMLELFFSGYINTICNEEDFKEKVYIVYSGGDDLFIVGPWSLIPKLAQRIYGDFKKYTCNNEDISLSGGIFICDAKFPVKRFAYLVNDELRKSKENGRDRITMFGETVPWTKTTDGKISFKELIEFSEDLTKYLQERKISRGFLHHLLRINKLCVEGSYQYFPYLVWQITRNIKDIDVKEALYKKFITDTEGKNWVANLKIPVCYALLKSRR